MRLRFNLAKAEPEFIRRLLMTAGGRQLFLKASRRSAVQYNINTKEISALRIPVPPLPLQRDFAPQVSAGWAETCRAVGPCVSSLPSRSCIGVSLLSPRILA